MQSAQLFILLINIYAMAILVANKIDRLSTYFLKYVLFHVVFTLNLAIYVHFDRLGESGAIISLVKIVTGMLFVIALLFLYFKYEYILPI